jgi:8-oxo-dGTP diphosphatase
MDYNVYMQKITNCFYRVSVKGLILDDRKRFLLTKEDNDIWELPGGGLNYGESPKECLKREIKEEMGLEVTSIDDYPSYFLTTCSKRSKAWIANVIYLTTVKDLKFSSSDECTEIGFFTKIEVVSKNVYENVKEFARLYDSKNH